MKWIENEEFEKLYKISESGEVFSVRSDRFLKGWLAKSGYPTVQLSNNGSKKSKLVHRLVAEAFIPNPENKPHINHIDGDKQNNNVENLEWCTQSENVKHSFALGLSSSRRGTDNESSKLSEEEVIAIMNYKAQGKYPTEISRLIGLKVSTVENVYYGKSWGWLTHETI